MTTEAPHNALLPTLVRASAGTGKTYQLTARLLRVLLQDSAPETILATTFTRKAAGEILNRVLEVLAKAGEDDDPEALQALREQVGISTLQHQTCRQLLHRLVRNIHRLRICTLDSLFTQLARSFPFELRLPPAWRLTDEIEEVWIQEKAIQRVVSTLNPSEMTTMLTMLGKGEIKRSIQRELMQVVDTAYGIHRRCPPDAWNKMVAPRRPEQADQTRAVGDFRSASPKQETVLAKLQLLADATETGDFKSLVDETLIRNIAKARRTHTEVKFGRSKLPDGLDDALDTVYAAVRTELIGLLSAQNEATGTILTAYDFHVNAIKQVGRVLSFEDVAVRLSKLFSAIDYDTLVNRMDGAIDHLLLDEFQDTSPAQWQVLRPLAVRACDRDAVAKDGAEWQSSRSFFCVGDTKQAIYGWRGGVAEIFDAVTDQIDGIAESEQNMSFRSSPDIMDFVNVVFSNLARHPMVREGDPKDPADKSAHEAAAIHRFAQRFPQHEANKKTLKGFVQIRTSSKVEKGDKDANDAACFQDAADLISEIAADAPDKTVGVLTRTNAAVAELITLLESRDVEVSQEGGNPLTDSAAVVTVLSALMMAEHPGDGRWRFHVEPTLLAADRSLDADSIRRRVEQRGIAETVQSLCETLAPLCGPRDTLRLKQLTHLAIGYENNPQPRLRDFVRLVQEKRVERPQRAQVRVMTVHQAKGLEFDAVVLPQLDGPLTRSSGNCVSDAKSLSQPAQAITRYIGQDHWHFLDKKWQFAFGNQGASAMTEALCLLYVATTRAKQALYLVIQPSKKKEFHLKTAASLIYHAVGCEEDPTQPNEVMHESGTPIWFGDADKERVKEVPAKTVKIQFRHATSETTDVPEDLSEL
ncbi:UvrD-helicase domain-containing protein [Novipirellula artificiosorum]|uniref:DNA 3'-5' helicase n=1 Tax=Novipirellula artificiosorum TaxID=2528016 RepID=A0A5C6D7I3_9BACT|nr:UvrD-helicase domain-containing protein [Novipirellula artificiosorum]TWU32892.1 ATP-dependent helicase/nuclease subunit A [Novipirellula artificiosorum]